MKIYVMRHGTTNWNEQGRTQGRTQNRLSAAGVELAETRAKEYKDVQFDVIYASPLMRTMQTARIMNQYHNVPLIKDDRIIEIDQGVFSKRLWRLLTDEEKELKAKRDISCKMEPFADVLKRTKEFLDWLIENEKRENVLVVSHNNLCSFMECIFKNEEIDFDNHAQINSFGNAEVKCFEVSVE